MDNADLIKRFDRLASDRSTIQEIWDAIERFITPYRGRFFADKRTEHSIEWNQRHVYDSTAIMAHQTLSASLHGALTSPSIKWFQLRFREKHLSESTKAMTWLEQCAEEVHWALQDSNFNLEVNETYQDLCGFGTGFLMLEEGAARQGQWGGLMFSSIPMKEGFFEEDAYGQPVRFYRCLKWRPAQIVAKFGKDAPAKIVEMDKKGNTDRQDVLFVVTPRHNRLTKLAEKQAPSKRAWEYRYIWKKAAETIGKPGGYYEMPVFVPRWRKTSESQWGNSPAMIALSDVLTLNHARKMQLVAAEKLIDPPILSEERTVIGQLDMRPATHNVVRDINSIKAFNTEGSIPVSDAMITQLQEAVKDYFFIDQLRMPAPQAQPMTATEVQLRYEQMQRLLGPTLGRLQSDMLDPIVGRTFKMLARAGRLPEPPEAVVNTNPEYDIEYLGSLSRSQKIDSVAAIERWAMLGANLAGVMPEVLDVPDPVQIMREAAKALNVPPSAARDKAEIENRQAERAVQQRQMAQTMQAQAEGEAMQSVAQGSQAMEAVSGEATDTGEV